jgi:thiosulfate/3-mercaptopyruvate sulfurtransferase
MKRKLAGALPRMLVGGVALLAVAGCAVSPQGMVVQVPAEAAVTTEIGAADSGPRGFEEVVVSTDWVAEHLDDPTVRLIEVSVVPGVYERGHIPGAVNFPARDCEPRTLSGASPGRRDQR